METLDFKAIEAELLEDGYKTVFKRSLHKQLEAINNSVTPNFKRLDELRMESEEIYKKWKEHKII